MKTSLPDGDLFPLSRHLGRTKGCARKRGKRTLVRCFVHSTARMGKTNSEEIGSSSEMRECITMEPRASSSSSTTLAEAVFSPFPYERCGTQMRRSTHAEEAMPLIICPFQKRGVRVLLLQPLYLPARPLDSVPESASFASTNAPFARSVSSRHSHNLGQGFLLKSTLGSLRTLPLAYLLSQQILLLSLIQRSILMHKAHPRIQLWIPRQPLL
jgi:hypothetical protein